MRAPKHKDKEFASDLKRLMNRKKDSGESLRPFVCEGYPMDCKMFIVGINPANEFRSADNPAENDFDAFWNKDDSARFDKAGWLDAYIIANGKLSRSRKCIELVVGAALPCCCLETYVYSVESQEPKRRWKTNPDSSEIFRFLVAKIKPKVILVHGKDAFEAVSSTICPEFDIEDWRDSECDGGDGEIFLRTVIHFRRTSFERATTIGADLRRKCKAKL